jgi:hypothetical protein
MTRYKGGDIVIKDEWLVHRIPIDNGDFDYNIFHNNEYFATAPSMTRAQRIVIALQHSVTELGGI